MTMQVGMVGTDGVLIASDTRWMNTLNRISGHQTLVSPRHTFNSPKIMVNDERGIAVSCAKNMETARNVATEILANLKEEELQYPCLPIQKIGERVLASAGDRNDAQCLIAFTLPTPRLFLFQFATVNGNYGSWCQKMETKICAGDNINSAIFWAERYYKPQPIEQLVPLASHLILSASKLNPAAISGLEIVLCDASGIRRIADDSLRELESKATKWDESIGELFGNCPQQFSYAPNMIG